MKERIEELLTAALVARSQMEDMVHGGSSANEPGVYHAQLREAIYTCTAALIEAIGEQAKASLPRCGFNGCWLETGHLGNCSHDVP